jgi:hypothetical protein
LNSSVVCYGGFGGSGIGSGRGQNTVSSFVQNVTIVNSSILSEGRSGGSGIGSGYAHGRFRSLILLQF